MMKNLAIVGLLVVILVLLYTRRLSFMDSTCQPGFELISGMCWGACPGGQRPFGTVCQKKDPVFNFWMLTGMRPSAPTNEVLKEQAKQAATKTAEKTCKQIMQPCPKGTMDAGGDKCWDFNKFPAKLISRPMVTACA